MQLINKYSQFPQNKLTKYLLLVPLSDMVFIGDKLEGSKASDTHCNWRSTLLCPSYKSKAGPFFLGHWSYFKYRNEKREEWMPASCWSSWMWTTTQPGENKPFIFVFHKSSYPPPPPACLSSLLLGCGESHSPALVSHIPPILTTVLIQMPCCINKHL